MYMLALMWSSEVLISCMLCLKLLVLGCLFTCPHSVCFSVRVSGGRSRKGDEQKSSRSAILFHVNTDKSVQSI